MSHMDSKLYAAVISGDNDALKEAEGRLSVGDQRTPTNLNVLHLASQYGHLRCVIQILSIHPLLLISLNSRGESALHLSAREGHYGVSRALINAAKSSVIDINQLPNGSSSVVEYLIRTADLEFETPLHKAVRYNHLKVVEMLVTEDPTHLHPPNKNDETPLYQASLRGYTDIVKIILDKCASPTSGGPYGRTALHAAALDHHGQTECLTLLLDNKKELIKIADDHGWTVFHYVAHKNRYDIVEDLVNADISVAYLADKVYKRIPLHIAAYGGHIKVMEKLLKYCPDSWDIVDGSGRNILHIAVHQFCQPMIRYILKDCKEIKILLTQKDKEGNTPLHLMAKLGCYVREVIHHKQVDWEVLNDENLTPLDILHRHGEELVDQLTFRRQLNGAANVKKQWGLVNTAREPDTEKAMALRIDKQRQKLVHRMDKMISTHMVVVALIATIALTAGFTMPGGFNGEGSPNIIKKRAFRAFMVTDTIAVLSSVSSLVTYFMITLFTSRTIREMSFWAVVLNIFSITALMLAFITGTYAVLEQSSYLSISFCVFSSIFLLFCYWYAVIAPVLRYIYYYRRIYCGPSAIPRLFHFQ